ncbi:MAG: membrane protein insertase YidC [Burkholderiaceae bacterium]|nr:membrane protein insertase YidC [Burkholderiaceae bacterium]
MQTQRMILWIVFSMSLLFLWDSWQRHQGHASLFGGPPPAEQGVHENPAGRSGTGPSAKDGAASDAAIPPPTSPAPGAAASGTAGAAASAQATSGAAVASEQTIRLANDVLSLDIDLLGGQVRRAELLGHREENGEEAQNLVLLQYAPGRIYLAQSGLIGDSPAGASFPTHRTPMTPVGGDASPRTLGAGNDVQLKLEAESGGLRLVRTYTLARGEYVVRVKDEVTNESQAPLSPVLYLQLTRDGDAPPGGSKFYSTYTGPVVYTNEDKFQKVSFSDIEKGKANYAKSAADGWAGIIQHYFVAAWIPQQGAQREYYARKVDNNLYSVGIKEPLGALAPNATTSAESELLVGPQKQRMLEAIAPGLDLTVDYGWLTVIAKPIYWLLEKLHALVGNWGWSIVLLTLLIKTIFFPLQAASYKSMARMKAVTPRLTAIRERYGNDRVKMNQAMMELYKTEKINPLGGCLPIVVQIPVFIALYWVLLASVEMRNAPWIGWIHDLSAPDPYFILPLVMAGTMFIQVKLNPTPPDPIQAKMMMIMPLVFSVMFFFFPAGLVLYWLVNNVYSIAQQWVINKKLGVLKK